MLVERVSTEPPPARDELIIVIDRWDPDNQPHASIGLSAWTGCPPEHDLSLLDGPVRSFDTGERAAWMRSIYKELLPGLADLMNAAHSSDLPAGEWEIYLGALPAQVVERVLFVRAMIDRARSIGRSHRWISTSSARLEPTATIRSAHDLVFSPEYLSSVCEAMLLELGLGIEHRAERQVPPAQSNGRARIPLDAGRLRGARRLLARSGRQEVAAFSATDKRLGRYLLLRTLGRIAPFPPPRSRSAAIEAEFDLTRREALRFVARSISNQRSYSPEVRVALQVLADVIPAAQLEAWPSLQAEAQGALRKRLNRLVLINEETDFKRAVVVAARRDGAELLIAQHGGLYGEAVPTAHELWERSVADRFVSWGWAGPLNNGPSIRLSHLAKSTGRRQRRRSERPEDVTWFEAPLRAPGREDDHSPHWSLAQRARLAYLEALWSNVGSSLVVRLRPAHRDRSRPDPVLDRFIRDREIRVDRSSDVAAQLHRSRLVCVESWGSTTFLECLTLGIPSQVLLPAPACVRPEVASLYQRLVDAGVVGTRPEVLCLTTSDPDSTLRWWGSPEVRAAVERYRSAFAHTRPDYLRWWRRTLLAARDA